jgi:hypothetical protein
MTPERRYSDDEVSKILDRATETHVERASGDGPAEGLSLSELQQIGDEVGIPKDAIRSAAASLDRPAASSAPEQSFLGARTGVGRSVTLSRALTEAEWNRLVVDLRETFGAKGTIKQEGAFRQWTNGNLQALVEPTDGGERVRLRTRKGSAYSFMASGGLMACVGAGGLLGGLGGSPEEIMVLAAMGAGGLVLHMGSRLSLPAWAHTRARQMEDIINRLTTNLDE